MRFPSPLPKGIMRRDEEPMPPFVTEAVILHTAELGERDRLVVLYGDERGKMRGVAKGAAASRKRFGANLDLLAHVRIHGFEKLHQGLVRVEGADLLEHFGGLRTQLQAFARGCYLSEWMDGCTAERQPLPGLQSLLLVVLRALEAGKGGEGLIRIFEMKLLDLAGYGPKLDRCVACGDDLGNEGRVRVQVERGGALCRVCAAGRSQGLRISMGTLRALQDARGLDLRRLHRMALSLEAVEESRSLMRAFYGFHVGRPLRSTTLLEKLERGTLAP